MSKDNEVHKWKGKEFFYLFQKKDRKKNRIHIVCLIFFFLTCMIFYVAVIDDKL